jgi:flagellar protein FlaF
MQQINAYLQTKQEIVDPREMERRVFVRVTEQLRMAAEGETRSEFYHQAILDNRRLWSAVACDISDPSNMLPTDVKSGLLSIAVWVERESSAAHRGEGDLGTMIQINESVMAGLLSARGHDE